VRILVAMVKPKALERQVDDTGPYLAMACAVKLKLFDFVFHRERLILLRTPLSLLFFLETEG
jgi:hypothetical protein